VDNVLGNPVFSFTREILLSWGWFELKSSPDLKPAEYPRDMESEFHAFKNIIPLESLILWKAYVERISPFEAIRSRLRAGLKAALEPIDTVWRREFSQLEHMSITDTNFVSNGIPIPEAQSAIPYFKDFISYLYLLEVPNFPKEAFYPFEGISNLRGLCLQKMDLGGGCLAPFRNSRFSLDQLLITANKFRDRDLRHFEGAAKLTSLGILANPVTSECMKYFRNSVASIVNLMAEETDERNGMDFFKFFPKGKIWQCIGISDVKGDVVYEHFLRYSFRTMKNLRIYNGGVSDELFQIFEHCSVLERLELSSNDGLKGENLYWLENSRMTLQNLNLSDTRIKEDNLRYLLDFPKLNKLTVLNCSRLGMGIVREFQERGVSVIHNFPE